jgi:Fe2+ or Zn2+ uptake regulation protein
MKENVSFHRLLTARRGLIGGGGGGHRRRRNHHHHHHHVVCLNPLNAELNPIRHLLALAGAHHFVDVSRIRVNRGS